ncbi:hypothetical protein GGI43DRAFT_419483 [Trichoderma evansii]
MSELFKIGKIAAVIKPLESLNGWIVWERKVLEAIKMNGFGDLLLKNKGSPQKEATESDADFTVGHGDWEDRQEQMVAFVHSRLAFLPHKLVKDETVLATIMDKLRTRYKPVGSAVFQDLDRKYSTLTLAECTSVADYTQQLRTAHKELLQLDNSV